MERSKSKAGVVTIKEVAEMAGVSKSTVSNVLNKTANVKEETCHRVLLAIEALNFTPSSNARNLKAAKSNEVGVVIPDINDTINRDILNGVCSVMQRAHYFVNIAFSNGDCAMEQDKVRMLLSKQIDGLILLSCQDENSAFFTQNFHRLSLPAYFVLRKPQNIPCNYAVFDTFQIVTDITMQMLKLGYRKISLVCGPASYANESAAIDAFSQAHATYGIIDYKERICCTRLTKEDAFKMTMLCYQDQIPDAVIATSSAIAKGLVETMFLLSQKVGEDITVVCLGDEGWCRANQINSILTTNSNAYQLGIETAENLLHIIQHKKDTRNHGILMKDTFNIKLIPPPAPKKPEIRLIKSTNTLNILAAPLQSTDVLKQLSRYFEATRKNTKINIHKAENSEEILKILREENSRQKCLYDIYLFDNSYLNYIAHNQLLMDLSDYVNSTGENIHHIISHYLKNCQINGHYYGIPLAVCCQLLFYRRDLFEDEEIQKLYKMKYSASLHVPRTWIEFNRICEFFTRRENPQSPVQYGTALGMTRPEELITLIRPYLRAFHAAPFDSAYKPTLNTPAFQKGIQEFLKTVSYAKPQFKKMTLQDSALEFLNGTCAMCLNTSDNIAALCSSHQSIDRIGFAFPPGRDSIFSSWSLGVSRFASNLNMVYDYLNWTCSPTMNYYLAILSGQSPAREPYLNNELKRIYPWMDMLQYSASSTPRMLSPIKNGVALIPQNRMESVITNLLYDIIFYNSRLSDSLPKAQNAMEQLFKEYCI